MVLAWRSELLARSGSCPLFFAFLLLFHLPLAAKKGASYVIWSEQSDSDLKHYWFFSIFLAALLGASSTLSVLNFCLNLFNLVASECLVSLCAILTHLRQTAIHIDSATGDIRPTFAGEE